MNIARIVQLFVAICAAAASASNSTTSGYTGVDISAVLSSTQASCLAGEGRSFVVVRAFRSSGVVDTNVCTSLKAASSGGIKTREVYLFPCPTCSSSAAAQMSTMLSYLSSNCNSEWTGRVWLDIEGAQYWSTSTSTNKAWYESLVDACRTQAKSCGIYASASQWTALFGSTSYVYGNDLPLWYAHYDSLAAFSDYSSFGGWVTPHAKQFKGTTTDCNMSVDENWSSATF